MNIDGFDPSSGCTSGAIKKKKTETIVKVKLSANLICSKKKKKKTKECIFELAPNSCIWDKWIKLETEYSNLSICTWPFPKYSWFIMECFELWTKKPGNILCKVWIKREKNIQTLLDFSFSFCSCCFCWNSLYNRKKPTNCFLNKRINWYWSV